MDLVEEASSMSSIDEEDVRMERKLKLLLELVQGLDCRSVGNSSNRGLVHRIITGLVLLP